MTKRDWPWSELGIDPPVEERDIKRAYAVLLKKTRPQDDPVGYQNLRTAYDAALQMVRYDYAVTVENANLEEVEEDEEDEEDEDQTNPERGVETDSPAYPPADAVQNLDTICINLIKDFEERLELPHVKTRKEAIISWVNSPQLDVFEVRSTLSPVIFGRVLAIVGSYDEWNRDTSLTPEMIKSIGERFFWLDDQLHLGYQFEHEFGVEVLEKVFGFIEPKRTQLVEKTKSPRWATIRTIAYALVATVVANCAIRSLNESMAAAALSDARAAFLEVNDIEAERILRPLVAGSNSSGSARMLLAAVLVRQQKPDEACVVSRKVFERNLPWQMTVLSKPGPEGEPTYPPEFLRRFIEATYACYPDAMFINEYVWLLATTTDAQLRDGSAAIYWGEKVLAEHSENPMFLDTLAAAYAESGDFDRAAEIQRSAIKHLEREFEKMNPNQKAFWETAVEGFKERCTLYEQDRPYRERSGA